MQSDIGKPSGIVLQEARTLSADVAASVQVRNQTHAAAAAGNLVLLS